MKPGDRRHRPAIPDRWLAQIDVAIIPPADGIGRQVEGDFRVQIDDPFGMAPDIVANEAQGMLQKAGDAAQVGQMPGQVRIADPAPVMGGLQRQDRQNRQLGVVCGRGRNPTLSRARAFHSP